MKWIRRATFGGSVKPGGLLPEAAARHIQSATAHMGQVLWERIFSSRCFGVDSATKKIGSSLEKPDLICEPIVCIFSAESVKNEHHVKKSPSGGGGNFL